MSSPLSLQEQGTRSHVSQIGPAVLKKKKFVFFYWGEAWEEALAAFERSPVERSVERSSTYMKPVRFEFLHLILNRLETFDPNLSRCVFRYVAPNDNDASLMNDEPVWNVQGPLLE